MTDTNTKQMIPVRSGKKHTIIVYSCRNNEGIIETRHAKWHKYKSTHVDHLPHDLDYNKNNASTASTINTEYRKHRNFRAHNFIGLNFRG